MKLSEGAAFNPETITILQSALDDAWSKLSPEQQAATDKGTLAERILGLAAQGERDPIRLRNGAVSG
jgi:hypothetical protein